MYLNKRIFEQAKCTCL